MLRCPCGGSEFRATQKSFLSVIVAVPEQGPAEVVREDSSDGVKPNITDCDPPTGLCCLGCGREYETGEDVRRTAIQAELEAAKTAEPQA